MLCISPIPRNAYFNDPRKAAFLKAFFPFSPVTMVSNTHIHTHTHTHIYIYGNAATGLERTGWLVVLGFNATLTATVISWRSVTHMCFLAFSHQYLHNFSFQSHRLLFSHASVRREAKIRLK